MKRHKSVFLFEGLYLKPMQHSNGRTQGNSERELEGSKVLVVKATCLQQRIVPLVLDDHEFKPAANYLFGYGGRGHKELPDTTIDRLVHLWQEIQRIEPCPDLHIAALPQPKNVRHIRRRTRRERIAKAPKFQGSSRKHMVSRDPQQCHPCHRSCLGHGISLPDDFHHEILRTTVSSSSKQGGNDAGGEGRKVKFFDQNG
jgi:hypothetical protein